MAATVSTEAGAYISISRKYSDISKCFILNDCVSVTVFGMHTIAFGMFLVRELYV
jgi:hypothetical protein